jgi:uncharacterized Ntn-hydrolase superfamily protein
VVLTTRTGETNVTYSILAKCPETNRLGVGIATYSLGVGGYCPFFARGKAVISTQAFANPRLGPRALDALAMNHAPAETLKMVAASDPGFEYRQVSIVGVDGAVAMHTGHSCRTWAGHETGDGFAAFGNVLAGEGIVAAIANSFRQSVGEELGERLLLALEAGRGAGGQAAADGARLPERSAALIVMDADITRDVNLRVDLHDDAIIELRRVHAGYAPYVDYYALRADDPANTPPQDVWAQENL